MSDETHRLAFSRPEPVGDGEGAAEPFGYWVAQKGAEPALLRKPAYIPEPSELRTITPLYARPAPVGDEALVERRLRGKLTYAESIIRAYIKATGFDHAAACPICKGIEGCSHTFAERFRGGREEALVERVAGHWDSADGLRMAEVFASKTRGELAHGTMPDFALANRVFLAGRDDIDLISWQQAAKDRIRWLSVQLVLARAAIQAIPAPATDAGQSADEPEGAESCPACGGHGWTL